jgi:hypothetical protein
MATASLDQETATRSIRFSMRRINRFWPPRQNFKRLLTTRGTEKPRMEARSRDRKARIICLSACWRAFGGPGHQHGLCQRPARRRVREVGRRDRAKPAHAPRACPSVDDNERDSQAAQVQLKTDTAPARARSSAAKMPRPWKRKVPHYGACYGLTSL